MHIADANIKLLENLYRRVLAAGDPRQVLAAHLPAPPKGRTVIVGAGKAAAAMAQAVEENWRGSLSGVVAVPAGSTLSLRHIRHIEASHPLPDERSVSAAQALMGAVKGLSADDLVLALISGGGSALCALPVQGVTLIEKQAITRDLQLRGATIHEINTVRKHLSAIKGGRLALSAHPACVVSLLISDIPGDDPSLIASAPTLPDQSTCADAWGVLERYAVQCPERIKQALNTGVWESPKPSDPRFKGHWHKVIASAQNGLVAAAQAARDQGWAVHILSDAMQGQARDLALAHAAIALQVRRHQQPFTAPCLLLSGGEATVTVTGTGRGGRNTEFALALALALRGEREIYALSAGTDGLDGSGAAAGAWITPQTLIRAHNLGLDPQKHLDNNDSFSFFAALDQTLVTGMTNTNINDFRALLIR